MAYDTDLSPFDGTEARSSFHKSYQIAIRGQLLLLPAKLGHSRFGFPIDERFQFIINFLSRLVSHASDGTHDCLHVGTARDSITKLAGVSILSNSRSL